MFTPGLVSISFRKLSPEKILSLMRSCGLQTVEWGSDIHAPKDEPEKLKAIAAMQKEAGISCCSYGTYFRLGRDSLTELDGYIDAAGILGTRVLRLWCGTKGSADYSPEEKEILFDNCRAAGRIAAKRGVIFCMECHPNTMTDCESSTLELMRQAGAPHFRMYFQPNQNQKDAENIRFAETIAPYTENIHTFNWRGKEKMPLENAIPLWKQYLAPMKGNHNLLLEFMPDDREESLPRESEALLKLIGEMQ